MKHPRLIALVFAFATLALVAVAQRNASITSPGATEPENERPLSKEISSALFSGIKYQPPGSLQPTAEEADPRDSDKPLNGIIRLPKFMVEDQRPPVFNERNLYSSEMLKRLAYLRYTTAFSRQLHLVPEWYAVMQYEADERRRNTAEMEEKVLMYRISGDAASANQLHDDIQRSFMRRSEGISIHVAGN
jgi:hypothetical protein